ncbi:hydrogenase [Candidatus Peregrinibacteria bacterium]|nr:hydrogenase [Candidatus Peregrinibacteria bacterium]MBT7737007.1 hydrogenase [Candidatus Peregrinibacteria bacterium]
MSFRESLEAFLIIAILLKFLDKTDNRNLKKSVWHGTSIGLIASVIFGLFLMILSSSIGGIDTTAKLWESLASLIAVILITTFIVWIINHGSEIKKHIENKAAINLSKKGILLLSTFMIAREGAELAIFAFAGKYEVLPIIAGSIVSIILVVLIHHSLVKIKLKTIFLITLFYLIIQAGFLMGYSVHEGLSALKSMEILKEDSFIFKKAFDLSKTPFYHKEGLIGLPLYVLFGWYSKPEWIQFIIQYSYTALFFAYWYRKAKKVA